jgi:16S rRNA processing protein RimM
MSQKKSFSLNKKNSGSQEIGEPEFLAVGKLRRPHGVRGEILMSVWTEFSEHLEPGIEVFAGDDNLPLHIRSLRWNRDDLLIAFNEYSNREEVGLLRNEILKVRADNLPSLDAEGFYLHQLLGMEVIDDENGNPLGRINEIFETGANDVYIVRNEAGSEFLLPAIDQVILNIDVNLNRMRVHLLPGLLSDK